jgi:hypothetical protein
MCEQFSLLSRLGFTLPKRIHATVNRPRRLRPRLNRRSPVSARAEEALSLAGDATLRRAWE